MKARVFATLLLAASASASRYQDGPAGGLPWIVPDALEKGILPYVTVYRTDRMWEHKRAEAGEEGAVKKDYEWQIPVSTLEGTRAVAQEVLRAWQRLEERAYHHVMATITYHVGVSEASCRAKEASWPALSSWMGLSPDKPEPTTGTPKGVFPDGYAAPLPGRRANAEGKLRLDWYTYFHAGTARVPPRDYCDNLGGVNWPIVPLIGAWKVKLPAGVEISSPGYPDPIWIDMGELEARARKGMEHVVKKYVPEYEADVAKAVMTPRGKPDDLVSSLQSLLEDIKKATEGTGGSVPMPREPEVYLPTAWSGHEVGLGSLMTPVIRLVPGAEALDDLRKIVDILFTQASFTDKLLDAARFAYFVPRLKELVERTGLKIPLPAVTEKAEEALRLLIGPNYRDEKARGIWPLEELKRWLPPSLPQVHEALGYTTYYQVFARMELTTTPDPLQDWGAAEFPAVSFLRSLHIIHVPIVTDVSNPPYVLVYPDLPNVRPIFIAPYAVIYSGPRYYWDWVSVPDAYPIPRAVGVPVPLVPLLKR